MLIRPILDEPPGIFQDQRVGVRGKRYRIFQKSDRSDRLNADGQ